MSDGSSTTITLREANQGFAEMIRAVESGQEFVITRRGEPVARVVPVSRRRVLTPSQQEALERTRELAARGLDLGGWPGRDAIYEERMDELARRRGEK
ncbi:type II toxin-antitoxin system Phd/YefM family antitoxin [Mycobacterium sp. KBS0706]|jgi:prevent-host-death family protein|uniref:type II toxin-antitoxin system Phd/YefM family antitoxin n=1 Tax=Mycobacterium sp. KBS0706 TaxID=2578109 RepID=UPI00163DC500|nr:type II toxin-antitoxin system prevent-host-death family antitoxin [Mycobacterium sp. KBS0706]